MFSLIPDHGFSIIQMNLINKKYTKKSLQKISGFFSWFVTEILQVLNDRQGPTQLIKSDDSTLIKLMMGLCKWNQTKIL